MSQYYINKKTKLSRGVKNVLIDFSENTTAHGIPRIGRSRTKKARLFWIVICLLCSAVFLYLASLLVMKYTKYDKITQIELQFKNAPFPAVTLCNLNPYKMSLAEDVPQLRRVLNAFKVSQESLRNSAPELLTTTVAMRRHKRIPITYEYRYMPVYAFCRCPATKEGNSECLPFFDHKPREKDSQCVCFYDRVTKSPFRCFPVTYWTLRWCTRCELAGNCPPADLNKLESDSLGGDDEAYRYIAPCVCQNVTNYCIATADKPFGRLWLMNQTSQVSVQPFSIVPIQTTTTSVPDIITTTEFPIIEETAKDVGTMSSQAQESMVFAAAGLSDDVVRQISYTSHEFIKSCTFNQQDCVIERDFKEYIDPKYGTCFIFNWNSTQNRTSNRAGPMYGLGLLLYVNASDYLPMTPGKGVRMAVHSQTEYPFPDTFGYNAPTGFLTSFGIRLKTVRRIAWPRDDCVEDGKTAEYIFPNHSYSIEGCFRSCLQKILVSNCSCSDPLFPPFNKSIHCRLDDTPSRQCINRTKVLLGGLHGDFVSKCPECIQPCEQTVYDATFSTSTWPHANSVPNYYHLCGEDVDNCEEHLTKNAAYMEVYYEQLNYESLIESQAYPLANLLADLGGQLGLWLGFSVITIVEFLFLFYDVSRLCYSVERDKMKKKKKSKNLNGELYDDDVVTMTLKVGQVKFDTEVEVDQADVDIENKENKESDNHSDRSRRSERSSRSNRSSNRSEHWDYRNEVNFSPDGYRR